MRAAKKTMKSMRCYDCGDRIRATIQQAKAHGWILWVGGAFCKGCSGKVLMTDEVPS